MRIAAAQLPEIRNDVVGAVSLMHACALEAEESGARLVCFPECFLQGYDTRPGHVAGVAMEIDSSAFVEEVLERFGALEAVVVFGLIERDGGDIYNTAVAIERGNVVARYRKTHLLEGEKSVFRSGDVSPTFDVDGTKVGINICYDLCFSESVQRAVAAGAKLLVCPCNNMMPRKVAEEWQPRHTQIRALQAKRHGIWIASADVAGERDDWISYGPTAVIDPSGTVVARVPLSATGIVVADVE